MDQVSLDNMDVIVTIHINRFIDLVKAHEARGQRDFTMPMRDAKDLHSDITKLLLKVTELQQLTIAQAKNQTIEVSLSGPKF